MASAIDRQDDFGTGIARNERDIIDERTHQEDTSASLTQQIFLQSRIGKIARIEAAAVVAHTHTDCVVGDLDANFDLLGRIGTIAMDDGIRHSFHGCDDHVEPSLWR